MQLTMDEEEFREFLIESYESVDLIGKKLSELGQTNSVCDVIDEIYRRVHKIHGISGFLEFKILENLAKKAQCLLVELRKDPTKTSEKEKQALLAFNDTVKLILTNIQTQKNEGEISLEPLNEELDTISAQLKIKNNIDLLLPAVQNTENYPNDWDKLISNVTCKIDENKILVDVIVLDNLLNLVNERLAKLQLLLSSKPKNCLANYSELREDTELLTTIGESIRNVRLQPLRKVREELLPFISYISTRYKKKIKVIVQDDDLQIDKTIVSATKELLYQAISYFFSSLQGNNLVQKYDTQQSDFNIENTNQSDIIINFTYESGKIIFDLFDIIEGTNQREAYFNSVERISTADFSTNLETLKLKIESLGGKLEQFGISGRLTSLRFTLPNAVMAAPMLIVENNGEHFALPRGNIVKLVKLSKLEIKDEIEEIDGIYFYKNYRIPLPIISLSQALNGEKNSGLKLKDNLNIITTRVNSEEFGIVVDNIYQTEISLIKPLNKLLEDHQLFSAVTLLSDGKIAFVLDCTKIGNKFSLIKNSRFPFPSSIESFESVTSKSSDPHDIFMVVKIDKNFQVAIPINKVNKLEKVPPDSLIKQSHELFIKLKGHEVIPLVVYAAHENTKKDLFEHKDFISVVVITDGKKTIALLIESIVGITQHSGDTTKTNMDFLSNEKSEDFVSDKISRIVNVDDVKILESMYH